MQQLNPLINMELFQGVSPATLEALWSGGKILTLKKKDIIIRPKEVSDSIYVQLSGKSIIYNLTKHGRRKILFVLGPGSLLNEHIEKMYRDAFFCEALEPCQVFSVETELFLRLMESDFSLTRAVLIAQERKIWRLGHQLKNTMGSIYMDKKLAAKLWKLARDFGKEVPEGVEIDMNLSLTFLADMLGAPRETVSKICKVLVEKNLIMLKGKRVIVTKPDELSHYYVHGRGDET